MVTPDRDVPGTRARAGARSGVGWGVTVGVRGMVAVGEGVGGLVVDDVDFGYFWQGGGDFHFLDDVEKLWMDIVSYGPCLACS